MNSRWQASKIGLINFWYYDEQEFPFVKGRMLLRGSNGSGKSVTMQSVIPLLLDGNMSPERLDPFGSRDRKMSSYLLEEDDGKEERTGYLYLEFCRQESETYLTIGMGIRARRGKPLDKWYFSLTDGRRIGKDFYLYKDTGEKVTLSKKELENRVQGGGQVFDRQMEYMEYVNRQIFGFETVEEYKEMVDLLIQLRTPKLSKDFKPSVINEILSDSLQPLSDEDLRPMSEAIENMDVMSMNLKNRQEGKQAAEKINRILNRYNRLTLYEKAGNYEDSQKELALLQKEEKDRRQKMQDCLLRVEELERRRQELDAEKAAREKERESLNQSDAVALKSREMDLAARIAEKEAICKEKEEQLTAKQEQYIETESRRKEEQDRMYQKERELCALLTQMQAEAEEMAFEEHGFLQSELQEAFQEPYSFGTHQMQFEKTQTKIRQGLSVLQKAEIQKEKVENLLREREGHRRKNDAAQRHVQETENVLVQAQNEWKENFYGWCGRNRELILDTELQKELARFAEDYGAQSDFAGVRQAVADVWIEKKGNLESRIRLHRERISVLQEEYETWQKELSEWEDFREPEPPRSEAVCKNRERLERMQIPYQEFYRLIEFGQDLDQTACDRLEEALLHMGILDALVIEEQYKEQVLQADTGCHDNYLFVQKQRAGKSILDVLDLNDSVNDIFFNQRITGILENIAYEGEGTTAVSAEGTYQIGVLTGTVTGTHEAGFIGTRAREQRRQRKIRECRETLAALAADLEIQREETKELERRIRLLSEEYENLPAEEDLRVAYRMLLDAQREAEQLEKEGKRLEEQVREASGELQELKKEALQIAEGLYLTCSYETFEKADTAAREYGQHFYQLKAGHELYLQMVFHQQELKNRLEDLDADLDQIRYDKGNTERAREKECAEYRLVQEQLKLTDYEEIRERLDTCLDWLHAYPRELQSCMEEKGQKEQQVRQIQEQLEQSAQRIQVCVRQKEYLRKCYEAELELGMVELPKEDPESGKAAGRQGGNENPAKEDKETMRREKSGMERDGEHGGEEDRKEDVRFQAEEYKENADGTGGTRSQAEKYKESAGKVRSLLEPDCQNLQKEAVIADLNRIYFENRGFLNDYHLMQTELFEELEEERAGRGYPAAKRLAIYARYQGVRIPFGKLLHYLEEEIAELRELIKAGDRELFEDILANTMSRKIRGKINSSNAWVEKMNVLMGAMNTSSGLKLSLRWRSKTAEQEDQLDTKELVGLLKKDYRLMREEEAARLSLHFRSKVEEARRHARDSGGMISFYQVMKETLDYRKWFEFQLLYQKSQEKQKELTNSAFGTFSGGEKAMSMYVPLFSAVVAKYQGGRADAPRLISLDEAFAGVDNKNIRDMFRLMTEFQFDFIINSQVLWGDCDTLDALAIYQLIRPENVRFVTVMSYLWNGQVREMLEDEKELEQRAAGFAV